MIVSRLPKRWRRVDHKPFHDRRCGVVVGWGEDDLICTGMWASTDDDCIMAFWQVDRWLGALSVLNASWLIEPADDSLRVMGVATDSRAISPGCMFVALRGERFEGHDFVNQAIEAGASMVMIDAASRDEVAAMVGARGGGTQKAVAVLVVDDTLAGLQKLASIYREELAGRGCRVIAVTGSAGKTTTRRLIHQVLSDADYLGHQSPKSFNNHLGVPLTILGVRPEHEFVVAEVGMNHAGEIGPLAEILRPDVVVITNIGVAHIGLLGSREAIAGEKTKLFGAMSGDGFVVVPADEPLVDVYLPSDCAVYRFRATSVEHDRDGVRFRVNGIGGRGNEWGGEWGGEFFMPILGVHNASNAASAVVVARQLGLVDQVIGARLRCAVGQTMRMQVEQHDGVTILNDAYNANPDAMVAALDVLGRYPATNRRIAVIGEMGELGDHGPDLHRRVGRHLLKLSDQISRVVLIGGLSLYIAEILLREWSADRVATFAEWSDDLPTKIWRMIEGGDVLLIKGSRNMRLERLLDGWGVTNHDVL